MRAKLSYMARRVMRASKPLAAELIQRGVLRGEERRQIQAIDRRPKPRIRQSVLAAELANADRQLAARAVLRNLLSREELWALSAMLKFQPRGKRAKKLDELVRIVERAIAREN